MPNYTVRAGDTLSAIAARNGVSLSSILSANRNISNPNLIFPGQVIQIPYGGAAPSSGYDEPARPPFVIGSPERLTSTDVNKQSNGGGSSVPQASPTTGPIGQSAPTANISGAPSAPAPSGSGTAAPSGGTTVTPEQANALGPGVVKFAVQTASGVEERFVYFPPHVWAGIMGSPMKDKWGLDQTFFESGFPEIPIGRIEDWHQDLADFLDPTLYLEAQNVMKTVNVNQFDPDAIDPPPGFGWSIDPNTGERTMVDLQPLVGPPASSWHYNEQTGQWFQVNDPTDIATSMFEGIPEGVRPWLQLALDNGGNASVVTDPAARAWVEFALAQHEGSSMRTPVDQPFGTGVPTFPGGQPGGNITPPAFGAGGNLVTGAGVGAPSMPTPGVRPTITAADIFAGSRFNAVGPEFAGVDEFQSSLDSLMGGSVAGVSTDIFDSDTALGHFYRNLRDQGLIDVVNQGETLTPQEQAAHNAARQAAGLPPINFNNQVNITWKAGPRGSEFTPGDNITPPMPPSPSTGVSAPAPPAASVPNTPPVSSVPPLTQLQQAQQSGQLPAGSAGARAYENLYGPPAPPTQEEPWMAVVRDLQNKGFKIPGYAKGGSTTSKFFSVGEKGPEMVFNPTGAPIEIAPTKKIGDGGAPPKGLGARRPRHPRT